MNLLKKVLMFMFITCKEEIIDAAWEYNNGIIFSSPSNVLHFESGAKWTDEHPNFENVWHDTSEVPNIECQVLLIIRFKYYL